MIPLISPIRMSKAALLGSELLSLIEAMSSLLSAVVQILVRTVRVELYLSILSSNTRAKSAWVWTSGFASGSSDNLRAFRQYVSLSSRCAKA